MKHSQVAGLVVGWLAVALSMAAIGTASVARVGVDLTESQVPITVSARAPHRLDGLAAPIASSDNFFAVSAPDEPIASGATGAQFTKVDPAARTTPARTTGTSSPVTVTTSAPLTVIVSPVVAAPNGAQPAARQTPATTPSPATSSPTTPAPAATKPANAPVKHQPSSNAATASASPA